MTTRIPSAAAAEGMPDFFPDAVNHAALGHLSLRHLGDLHGALLTTAEVLRGLCCQPRFGTEAYNGAGEALDTLLDVVDSGVDAVAAEVGTRIPCDKAEAAERFFIVSLIEAHNRNSVEDVVAAVAREAAGVGAFKSQVTAR